MQVQNENLYESAKSRAYKALGILTIVFLIIVLVGSFCKGI